MIDGFVVSSYNLYLENIFRNMAQLDLKILENIDRRGDESTKDFDHFITSEFVPVNNYTVWPMISREISSFSDHKGKKLDSSMKIRENAYKYLFIDQDNYYPSMEGW